MGKDMENLDTMVRSLHQCVTFLPPEKMLFVVVLTRFIVNGAGNAVAGISAREVRQYLVDRLMDALQCLSPCNNANDTESRILAAFLSQFLPADRLPEQELTIVLMLVGRILHGSAWFWRHTGMPTGRSPQEVLETLRDGLTLVLLGHRIPNPRAGRQRVPEGSRSRSRSRH